LGEHEGEAFWSAMLEAARNETPPPLGGRWPRARERRHFRGPKCAKAVEWLRAQYKDPEAPLRSLVGCKTERRVIARVSKWPMFGPWAAFKLADLCERVYGLPLQFDRNIDLLYDEPRASLEMLAAEQNQSPRAIYDRLLGYFATRKAPPSYDRPVGVAEIESIVCKFKSARNGHYTIGKDIAEVRHALAGWGPTADCLLAHMPAEVLPGQAQAAE
jgi:hypothetical protein